MGRKQDNFKPGLYDKMFFQLFFLNDSRRASYPCLEYSMMFYVWLLGMQNLEDSLPNKNMTSNVSLGTMISQTIISITSNWS